MAGRADQLDPALRRLVTAAPMKDGRKLWWMLITWWAYLRHTVRRQDLHVASQDDAVGAMFVDQPGNFIESRLLVLRIDGNVEIRDTVPLDHAAQVVVVGDHAGNLAVQFAAVPAVQQIGQAMGLLLAISTTRFFTSESVIRHSMENSRAIGAKAWREAIQVERQRVGTDLVAHEEPAVIVVGMMAGFGDPAIVGGQEVTHLGATSRPRRDRRSPAEKCAWVYSRNIAKGRHSSGMAEKFSLGEGLSTGCCARE